VDRGRPGHGVNANNRSQRAAAWDDDRAAAWDDERAAAWDDDACVIGVDFGTLSGRALVVRARDGAELGTATRDYRHGVMDEVLAATGEPLPPVERSQSGTSDAL
jgi:hypothetical protein